MRASSLFGYGVFFVWVLWIGTDLLEGRYDKVLSGEIDWDVNLLWVIVIIIMVLIWRRFDNWLDNRYEVIRRRC